MGVPNGWLLACAVSLLFSPDPTTTAARGYTPDRLPEEAWLSHAETLSNEWGEAQATETRSGILIDSSLFPSAEAAEKAPTVNSIEGSGEADFEGTGGKVPRIVSRRLFLFSALGVWLAFLCLGFLSVDVRRPSAQKAGVRSKPDADMTVGKAPEEGEGPAEEGAAADLPAGPAFMAEDPTAEIRARVENVRGLLPAAKRLGAAVDSVQAKKLLRRVQETVGALEAEAAEVGNSKRFEAALEVALQAFGSLHQAAIEQAKAAAKLDSPPLPFAVMEPWGDDAAGAMPDLEQEIASETMRPFMTSLRSVHQSILKLSQRRSELHSRLSTGRHFVGEDDGHLLTSAASDFGLLRATTEAKRRATEAAEELKEGILDVIRTSLLARRENAWLLLRKDMELVEVYAALEVDARGTDEDSGGAASPTAFARGNSMERLQSMIEEVETLLLQVGSDNQSVRTKDTVEHVAAAAERATVTEMQAAALLARCWEVADSLPGLPEHLNSIATQMLRDISQRIQRRARSDNNLVQGVVEEIQETSAEFFPGMGDPSTTIKKQNLRLSLVVDLMKKVTEVVHRAETRTKEAEETVQALRRVTRLQPALEQTSKARASLIALAMLKEEAFLFRLSYHLMAFLEKEVDYTTTLAALAASYKFGAPCPEKEQLKGLQAQLKAAKTAVEEAKTLTEAAEAVARMRAHAEAMDDVVYGYMTARLTSL